MKPMPWQYPTCALEQRASAAERDAPHIDTGTTTRRMHTHTHPLVVLRICAQHTQKRRLAGAAHFREHGVQGECAVDVALDGLHDLVRRADGPPKQRRVQVLVLRLAPVRVGEQHPRAAAQPVGDALAAPLLELLLPLEAVAGNVTARRAHIAALPRSAPRHTNARTTQRNDSRRGAVIQQPRADETQRTTARQQRTSPTWRTWPSTF